MVGKLRFVVGKRRFRGRKTPFRGTVVPPIITLSRQMTIERNKVTKANPLIEAQYSLSLYESLLLQMAISKIDSRRAVSGFVDVTLTPADIDNLLKHRQLADASHARQRLLAAVDEIQTRIIRAVQPDGKHLTFHWLDRSLYDPDMDTVQLRVSEDAARYLTDLRSKFTSYPLSQVLAFRSRYAFRFLEWKYRHAETGTWTMTPDEIRERLDLRDKYNDRRNLLRCVIEPAIQEVNASDETYDLKISSLAPKRKFRAFQFDIVSKQA